MGSTFFLDLPVFSMSEHHSSPPPSPPHLSIPAPPVVQDGGKIDDDDDHYNEDNNNRIAGELVDDFTNRVRPFSIFLSDEKSSPEVLNTTPAAAAMPCPYRRRLLVVDDSSTNMRETRKHVILLYYEFLTLFSLCPHCSKPLRMMLRRMLESRTNAEVLGGEVLVEEADDGLTALKAFKSVTE